MIVLGVVGLGTHTYGNNRFLVLCIPLFRALSSYYPLVKLLWKMTKGNWKKGAFAHT